MVLSLVFFSSFPTVGFGDDGPGRLKACKLQQYVADALAQTRDEAGGAFAASQGFGSPLPASELPSVEGLLRLLPLDTTSVSKNGQQQKHEQQQQGSQLAPGQHQPQRRRSGGSRRSSSSTGSGFRGQGKIATPASPSAIASPCAVSVSTLSPPTSPAATPDSCSGTLAQTIAPSGAASESLPASGSLPHFGSSHEEVASSSAGSSYFGPHVDQRSVSSLTPTSSFGEAHLERLLSTSGGSTAAGPAVDLRFIIERLKQPRQTGQVCIWGWEQAVKLSHTRRSMPTELFATLWGATEACAGRCHPQDVLGMLESWYTLMQTCPRHFRLRVPALESLIVYSIPAACKRMTERQLGQLASLCSEIALLRCDSNTDLSSGQGASARDLMQPIFALAAAEAAWRCNNEVRYVSVQTLSAIDRASMAWRWKVVRHRDSRQLAALKMATSTALEVLQGHIPG